MKGLVYKDCCILRKKCTMMLLFCVIYAVWGLVQPEMSLLVSMIGAVVPTLVTTTIAYDVASRFNRFSLVLPLSCEKVVGAKYLLLLVLVLASWSLVTLINTVYGLCVPGFDWSLAAYVALLVSGVGLLLNGAMMPFIYRFGAERARIFATVITTLLTAGIGFKFASAQSTEALQWLESGSLRWLVLLGFWCVCLFVTAISCLASSHVYAKHHVA